MKRVRFWLVFYGGRDVFDCPSTNVLAHWSTIGDVRKCTDGEHSIWSGGSKIKDLAQCGWEEKKMKDKKERKNEILR